MIKYNIECIKCKKNFDSWFASSKEYEKLKKLNLINCSYCNSSKVKKSLMSPMVLNKKTIEIIKTKDDKKLKKFKEKIKEYQKFIQNNFEYVGNNFAFEARSIHYKTKKKSKGIYGKASNEDIKSLNEEGIETQTIPWINNKEN